MITIYNGSDKNIKAVVDNKEYTIGTGMEPLVLGSKPTKVVLADVNVPLNDNFSNIIYSTKVGQCVVVAGVKYCTGIRVNNDTLYVTKKGLFAADENGLLNNYSFFTGDKRMFTVTSKCKNNIRVGAVSPTLTVLQCNDQTIVQPGQVELFIINGARKFGINLAQLSSQCPSVNQIVLCDDATSTTYRDCTGAYQTQDFTIIYITLSGKIYYSGKTLYSPFLMKLLLIIILLVIIAFGMLVAGYLYRNKLSLNNF